MARLSIVPSGVDTIPLSIDGATVFVDLRAAVQRDDKAGDDKGKDDKDKGNGDREHKPEGASGSDEAGKDGKITKPPGPIILFPYMLSLPSGDRGQAVLESVHLSFAHIDSGLSEIARTLGSTAIPEGAAHQLVLRRPADRPLDLNDLVKSFGQLGERYQITVLVTGENA